MNQAGTRTESKWTDAKRVAAVRKWHRLWEEFSRQATETMLAALPDPNGLRVLDLACGSGEPALSLAAAVGPQGRVIATDLGRDILAIAEENARRRGLANITFQEADAQSLPFPDGSFDAVTCRFGIMFFSDTRKALRDCLRVVKPRGRAVFLAWRSPEQPFWKNTVGILHKYADLPPDPPDAPLPFRFAQVGKLYGVFTEAGFQEVREEARGISLAWPGPPEQLSEYFQESATTYRPYVESLAPEARQKFTEEVVAAFKPYYDGKVVQLPAVVVIAMGIRA